MSFFFPHYRLRWSITIILLYWARCAIHLPIIKLSRFVTMIDHVQPTDSIPCNLSTETKFARGLLQAASVTHARTSSRKTIQSLSIGIPHRLFTGIPLSSSDATNECRIYKVYSMFWLIWFLPIYYFIRSVKICRNQPLFFLWEIILFYSRKMQQLFNINATSKNFTIQLF